MAENTQDLSTLTDQELIRQYVRCVQLRYATGHLGLQERIERKEQRILAVLKSRADGTARLLLPLSRHRDPCVQLAATLCCKSLDPETYREVMPILAKRRDNDHIGNQARIALYNDAHPAGEPTLHLRPPGYVWRSASELPTGITLAQLEWRVRSEFPAVIARRILALAQPTIGLWPRQLRENADPMTSRLGGMPCVPTDWYWPSLAGEPMLFAGQINCAELAGLPSARMFPESGLLAFFGDYDFLNCGGSDWRTAGGAVFHWTDMGALTPASEPIEDFLPLPRCGLAFYETYSLPDLNSQEIECLPLDLHQRQRYEKLHDAVRTHGHLGQHVADFETLKLLGWPDLIQYDFLSHPYDDLAGRRLLFQLGTYDDGTADHYWASGGAAYFLIFEEDLAAGRFDRVGFESQF